MASVCRKAVIMKIKNLITGICLGAVFGTAAIGSYRASDVYMGYTFEIESYAGNDYGIAAWQAKDTAASVHVVVESASNALDYRVMGATQESGANCTDCSNGYVYRISVRSQDASEYELYNWVNEWGYRYAAIRADSVVDQYTYHKGKYMAN
jgi:hypothetical protein